MTALEFSRRARVRPSPTGGKIREWKSLDGRYIVCEINTPGYGRWYRAVRVYVGGQTFASEARHKTRHAAEVACAKHRSN